MMDYAARYGLEFNPFLKNAKDILLDTAEASEVKLRLDYLGSTKGFGLLTGAKIPIAISGRSDAPEQTYLSLAACAAKLVK